MYACSKSRFDGWMCFLGVGAGGFLFGCCRPMLEPTSETGFSVATGGVIVVPPGWLVVLEAVKKRSISFCRRPASTAGCAHCMKAALTRSLHASMAAALASFGFEFTALVTACPWPSAP